MSFTAGLQPVCYCINMGPVNTFMTNTVGVVLVTDHWLKCVIECSDVGIHFRVAVNCLKRREDLGGEDRIGE